MLGKIGGKIKNFFRNRSRTARVSALILAVAAVLILPVAANAGVKEFFLQVVARLFELLAKLMGTIMIFEIRGLMAVAQYSNFVNPGPTAVRVGWVVTRDLANMFFILILLIIAFGTILGSEQYHYSKTLKRLLIMAVVINFSKTITGVFIDFGQVVMLTFVNGFRQAAGGNFLRAFQVEKMLQMRADAQIDASGLAIGMALAFFLLTVAASVMLVMLVMLAFRIIMLWLIIIMSPIAFLTSTMKQTQEYYAKWWKMLKDYVIAGPMLAFFLWLALISVQQGGGNIAQADGFTAIKTAADIEAERQRGQITETGAGFQSEVGRDDALLSFVIAVCLLMAGLKFAIESQTIGSGVAKGLQARAAGALKSAQGWAGKQAKRAVTLPYDTSKKGVQLATSRLKEGALRGGGRVLSGLTGGRVGAGMAVSGDKLRAERLKAKAGPAPRDLAKVSAAAFSKRAGAAKGDEALEFAKLAQQDPRLMAKMQSDGSAASLKKQLFARTKPDKDGNPTDFAAKAEYDAFMKANWRDEKNTPKETIEAVGKMTGEEARKYIGPKDFMTSTIPMNNLKKDALLDMMKNGSDVQKNVMAEKLEDMGKLGTLEGFFKGKGLSAADIPAEMLKHTPVNDSGRPAEGFLQQDSRMVIDTLLNVALKNPAAMKKFADNPKMAAALAPLSKTRSDETPAGKQRARETLMAVQLGAKFDEKEFTEDRRRDFADIDIKDLADAVRNAPDDDETQKRLKIAVQAKVQFGTPEAAKKVKEHFVLGDYAEGAINEADVAAVAKKAAEEEAKKLKQELEKEEARKKKEEESKTPPPRTPRPRTL